MFTPATSSDRNSSTRDSASPSGFSPGPAGSDRTGRNSYDQGSSGWGSSGWVRSDWGNSPQSASRGYTAPRSRSTTAPSRSRDRVHRLVTAVLLAIATILVSSGIAHATDPISCQEGTFCAWHDAEYRGQPHTTDLRASKLETCLPLPKGLEASSFVNHTGKPVTVYQDPTCDTDADFSTYPSGTFVPESPYVARAIQIWTH